jgi:hypothetical protein
MPIIKNIRNLVKKGLISYEILEEMPFLAGYADKKKLKNLKDKFSGERCFIIGNGPSLNEIDLTKINEEYSFGVNGIFYKTEECGFKPTFYVVEDKHVLKDNLSKIRSYTTDYKFFPSIYRKHIRSTENTIYFKMNRGFYEESSPNFSMPRFSTDCSKRVYCGQSVTIMNLQLAYYLGFTDIYLIGMDFSYTIPESAMVEGLEIESTEDDINHFHPDYFGVGKKWHDPQLEKVLLSYKQAKLMYEAAGRNITNATKGGNLNIFNRIDYNSLF